MLITFVTLFCTVSPDVRGAYFGSMDRAFEGFTYVGNTGSRYMVDHHSNNNAGSIGGSNHAHRRPSLNKNAFGKGPGHH